MRESVMAAAPRMSMSALNGTDDPDRQVRIWLLSAVNVKGATYYRVAGRFVSSGQTWQVNRRYSEFLMLRDTLVKYFSRAMDTCPGCLNYLHAIRSFDFPKKHVFVSKSQIVVNYRVKALRSFMNLLASWAFSNSPKCPTCGGFAFDIVRNFVLEGADAVGEISDMNYIRESFVVSTFTDAGRRSSLTRRNSFVPPSSQPANPQSQRRSMQVQQYQQSQRQSQLQRRNTSDSLPGSNQAQMDSDAYDAFNDYLVRHPTKSAHARSSINIPANLLKEQQQAAAAASRSSSSRQVSSSSSASQDPRDGTRPSSSSRQQPQRADQNGSTSTSGAHNGSFLFYQDGANHTSSSSRASSRQAPPSSTGSKHGILKNWNDVRQDRSQNGSYMSLGASSTDDDAKTPRGSKQRPHSRTRNDNRSQNNSYFSLGASSADSREANENVAPRSSNKHASQDYTAPQVRYDRSQNESYLSIGGSDNGDLEEEYHSHHPSVLASPTNARFVQPPPTQKYVGPSSSANDAPRSSQRQQQPKPSKSKSQRVMDEQSFTSDASLRFDGMVGVATDGSDSDDIDIAGVMIDDHHHPQLRKSKSGQGLWATWEHAKAS